MFNVNQVRKQFPIFGAAHGENPLVYLDNAATTQKPLVVLERLLRFYSFENANIHRGIYKLAHDATLKYEKARKTVASFINAQTPDEIVFCKGTTEAINTIAQGIRNQITRGDEILVTGMEHHANYVPWQVLCEQTGASFRVAPVLQDGTLDMKELKELISDKTRLLAITHISNTTGVINPIQEIVSMAHKYDCLTVIDAAQSIAFDEVDVKSIGCDFLAFSGHKCFGPTGIGVLFGKQEHLNNLFPYQQGGAMIVRVTESKSTFKQAPHGLEAGTPPIAEAISLGTALNYISDLDLKHIKSHSQSTLKYAKQQLSSIKGLTQLGPLEDTSNILSFLMKGIHPHDIATILSEAGIAVRAGHHCNQPLMDSLGINSTTRVSFSVYNDQDDVDHLVDALGTVNKIML